MVDNRLPTKIKLIMIFFLTSKAIKKLLEF